MPWLQAESWIKKKFFSINKQGDINFPHMSFATNMIQLYKFASTFSNLPISCCSFRYWGGYGTSCRGRCGTRRATSIRVGGCGGCRCHRGSCGRGDWVTLVVHQALILWVVGFLRCCFHTWGVGLSFLAGRVWFRVICRRKKYMVACSVEPKEGGKIISFDQLQAFGRN